MFFSLIKMITQIFSKARTPNPTPAFRRAFCGMTLLSAFVLSGCEAGIPNVSLLKTQYPVVQYNGPNKPFTVSLQKPRPKGWVELDQVSKAARDAILVSEDWAFYQHKGYDLNQIREAMLHDLQRGKFARGASTITQQVAKNVYLSSEKSMFRKASELVISMEMEKHLSKNRIFEVYLNIAEWGDGLFGIGEASRFYFQKPASALTAKEGAFLAMLLPSPRRYSQSFRSKKLTPYARKTIAQILKKMSQAHFLTEEERVSQTGMPLAWEKAPEPGEKIPSSAELAHELEEPTAPTAEEEARESAPEAEETSSEADSRAPKTHLNPNAI